MSYDPDIACSACGVVGPPDCEWRTFANLTQHIEARCGSCGTFFKWLPQVEPFLTLAGERPQQMALDL